MRFLLLNLLLIQEHRVDAELAPPALGFREAQVALTLGAEDLHPSRAPEKLHGAGLAGQRLVLGDAVLDQLRVKARDRAVPRGPRMLPVEPQERRDARDRGRMVVSVDRAVEAVAQERAKVVWEAVRVDAFALHEARVAERRFLGRPTSVDEHGGAAALLQVQSDADADDAGAKDERVSEGVLLQGNTTPSLRRRLRGGSPCRARR